MFNACSSYPAMEEDSSRDMISGLPDSVMCHMLSFLPIKYVVATSILSRKYKHIWRGIYIICFNDGLGGMDNDVSSVRVSASEDFVH